MWFLFTKNKECLKFTVMYLLNFVSKSDVMEKIINIVKKIFDKNRHKRYNRSCINLPTYVAKTQE